MDNRLINNIAVWMMLITLISACSGTKFTGEWKKSDYAGSAFKSILVIAMTENTTNRDIWEDNMATQLRKSGVTVITCGKAFTGDDKITKEQVLAYVKQHGTEAVLVTRLVDIKKERAYYQSSTGYMGASYGRFYYGPSNSFSDHYSHASNVIATPGYTATLTLVLLETNLYQSSSQDLVWSLSSESFDPQSVNDLVGIVGGKVVKSLTKNNLI